MKPTEHYQIFTSLRWDPTRPAQITSSLSPPQPTTPQTFLARDTLVSGYTIHPNDLLPYHFDRLVASAWSCGFNQTYTYLVDVLGDSGLRLAIDNFFSEGAVTSLCKLRIAFDQQGIVHLDCTPLSEPEEQAWLFLPIYPRLTDIYGGPQSTPAKVLGTPVTTPLSELAEHCPTSKMFFDSPTHTHSNSHLGTVFLSPALLRVSHFTQHKTTRRDMYDYAREQAGISSMPPNMAEVLLQNQKGEITEASLSTPYFRRDERWITPSQLCGGNQGVTQRFALEHLVCEQAVIRASSLIDGEIIWLSNAVRGFWRARLQMI